MHPESLDGLTRLTRESPNRRIVQGEVRRGANAQGAIFLAETHIEAFAADQLVEARSATKPDANLEWLAVETTLLAGVALTKRGRACGPGGGGQQGRAVHWLLRDRQAGPGSFLNRGRVCTNLAALLAVTADGKSRQANRRSA